MQRLTDDRGAVSTMVALLIVPIIAFAAIAIDVSGIWSERQQLQIGAEAAALAIAQDCGRGNCGDPAATAQAYATANVKGAVSATLLNSVAPSTGQVSVRATGTRNHLFAPVIGVDTTRISAQATARWGAPSGGTAVLPLAFSWCEFLAQTGGGVPSGTTPRTIRFTKTSGTTCTGPSNNVVPGGFGWLVPNAGSCSTTTSVDSLIISSPGESAPLTCSSSSFAALRNRSVLLPIFDAHGSTGSNAWYRVYAYAAFTVTGYRFTGQDAWNATPDCAGNVRCIKGYFTTFVDLGSTYTYSTTAPNLGAKVVTLTA